MSTTLQIVGRLAAVAVAASGWGCASLDTPPAAPLPLAPIPAVSSPVAPPAPPAHEIDGLFQGAEYAGWETGYPMATWTPFETTGIDYGPPAFDAWYQPVWFYRESVIFADCGTWYVEPCGWGTGYSPWYPRAGYHHGPMWSAWNDPCGWGSPRGSYYYHGSGSSRRHHHGKDVEQEARPPQPAPPATVSTPAPPRPKPEPPSRQEKTREAVAALREAVSIRLDDAAAAVRAHPGLALAVAIRHHNNVAATAGSSAARGPALNPAAPAPASVPKPLSTAASPERAASWARATGTAPAVRPDAARSGGGVWHHVVANRSPSTEPAPAPPAPRAFPGVSALRQSASPASPALPDQGSPRATLRSSVASAPPSAPRAQFIARPTVAPRTPAVAPASRPAAVQAERPVVAQVRSQIAARRASDEGGDSVAKRRPLAELAAERRGNRR